MKLALAVLIAVVTLPLPAAAQKKVYRCEENGRVTYADAPCKGGVEVAADDARSDAQRQAAREAVLREDKQAQRFRRERLADEAAAAKQRPGLIRHSAADAAASAVPSKKPAKRRVAEPKTAQP